MLVRIVMLDARIDSLSLHPILTTNVHLGVMLLNL